MNKKTLLLLTAFLSQMAAQAQNTSIDLDVNGLPDGTAVELRVASTHRQEPLIQATSVKNGKAYFAFDSDAPRLYALTTEKPQGHINVMATKGDHVKIYAVAQKRAGQRGEFYLFEPVQIKDSWLQDQLDSKLSIRKQMDADYKAYHEANKDILGKMRTAYNAGDKAAQDSLRKTEAYEKLAADEKAFFESVKKQYNELYLAHRDSWWGPFLVLHTMNWINRDVQPLFDQFSDKAKESFYGEALRQQLPPPDGAKPGAVPAARLREGQPRPAQDSAQVGTAPAVGQKVPDFTFTDHLSGSPTSLYAQLKGKRVLLFDVWASWCGPCRREIPNFKAMYDRYKDKGFGLVSISADQDKSAWLKALEEEQLPWANGLDEDKTISNLYNVRYYPTVYVVDSEGVVVAKDGDARGENLQTLLESLLQ